MLRGRRKQNWVNVQNKDQEPHGPGCLAWLCMPMHKQTTFDGYCHLYHPHHRYIFSGTCYERCTRPGTQRYVKWGLPVQLKSENIDPPKAHLRTMGMIRAMAQRGSWKSFRLGFKVFLSLGPQQLLLESEGDAHRVGQRKSWIGEHEQGWKGSKTEMSGRGERNHFRLLGKHER